MRKLQGGDSGSPVRPLHRVWLVTPSHLTAHPNVGDERFARGRYKETASELGHRFLHQKCLSSPLPQHTGTPRAHTHASSPFGYGSADVSKASFRMCAASLGALLNSLDALSPEPGAGKRHSHFLPFSTTGLDGLAPILGKQEVWGQKAMLSGGAGNGQPGPSRLLSSGHRSA